jgi:hypothetical protein
MKATVYPRYWGSYLKSLSCVAPAVRSFQPAGANGGFGHRALSLPQDMRAVEGERWARQGRAIHIRFVAHGATRLQPSHLFPSR